jgi:hypothetical protein
MVKNKSNKGLVIGILLAAIIVVGGIWLVTKNTTQGGGDGCNFASTLASNARDIFNKGTTLTGTKYFKVGNGQYTTTAYTSGNAGDVVSYWLSNSTHYCTPATITKTCGSQDIWNDCTINASVTLTAYDGFTTLTAGTGGATNITIAANGVGNVLIRYQGTAQKSAAPYGGVMVVEVDDAITTVTANGAGITDGTGSFHLTYTLTTTGNIAKMFYFDGQLDDGSGASKDIQLQFKAGSTNPTGTFYVTFYAANYYLDKNGNVVLDTEKYNNNQDSTKTGLSANVGSWSIT